MKAKALFIILLIASLKLSAQINKGAIMIEGGISLTGNWNYNADPFTEGFGISIGTNDHFSSDYFTKAEKVYSSSKNTNYIFAPKLGYALFKNFIVGFDFRYRRNSITESSNSTNVYKTKQYGVFARKYFGNHIIEPFLEGEVGGGLSQMAVIESTPGGMDEQEIERRNLFYLSGVAGISYAISTKLRVNVFAKVQHTREKPINTPNVTFDSRILDFDSALVLSFSYFFIRKAKE